MDALVLAAGYGTRLLRDARGTHWANLVKGMPKSLLPLGGSTLLEHLIGFILQGICVERVVVVGNRRHAWTFHTWWKGLPRSLWHRVQLIYDPSGSEEERLGALGSLRWALQNGIRTKEGLLVMAGDSLFMGGMGPGPWLTAFRQYRVMHLLVESTEPLRMKGRSGCVQVDERSRVVSYEEKPSDPKWPWRALPAYIYPHHVLGLLPSYLGEGGDPDAPGSWIPWLLERGVVVRCLVLEGRRFDCGSLQGYIDAREHFG